MPLTLYAPSAAASVAIGAFALALLAAAPPATALHNEGAGTPTLAPARVSANRASLDGRSTWLDVASISFAAVAPRDPASGLPTGKRMHKPIAVASLSTVPPEGTTLPTLDIEFDGATFHFQNVRVVESRNTVSAGPGHAFSFTYQRATWTKGGVTASDVWEN